MDGLAKDGQVLEAKTVFDEMINKEVKTGTYSQQYKLRWKHYKHVIVALHGFTTLICDWKYAFQPVVCFCLQMAIPTAL